MKSQYGTLKKIIIINYVIYFEASKENVPLFHWLIISKKDSGVLQHITALCGPRRETEISLFDVRPLVHH